MESQDAAREAAQQPGVQKHVGMQLDLFGRAASPVEVLPEVDTTPLPGDRPEDIVLPGQMDLFGDLRLRTIHAREAIEAFDLESASAILSEALERYPRDDSLRELEALRKKLAIALKESRCDHLTEARAFRAIAGEVPQSLRAFWHRRLADLIDAEFGEGAMLDDIPSGVHWLASGDTARAVRSLRATVAREPKNGRLLALLGDALVAHGSEGPARIAYRDALITAPMDIDIASLRDKSVAGLADIARKDFNVPGPPCEWAAAVGAVTGVLPLHGSGDPAVDAQDVQGAVDSEGPAGIRFYWLIVAEHLTQTHAERITHRRAMKELCPDLFAELLEQRRM